MDAGEVQKYFDENVLKYATKKFGQLSEFPLNSAALYSMMFESDVVVDKCLFPIQSIECLSENHIASTKKIKAGLEIVTRLCELINK